MLGSMSDSSTTSAYDSGWDAAPLVWLLSLVLVLGGGLWIALKVTQSALDALDLAGESIVLVILLLTMIFLLSWCSMQLLSDEDDLFAGSFASSFSTGFSSFSSPWTPANVGGQPVERSATGLYNLGNTCFLNSSVQCLSHIAPFAEYFISSEYERDVNTTNPLGTKGAVVKSFAALITELWSDRYSVVAPSSFKSTIAANNTTYAGWQQHDAQEFLAYLLDSIHEDLNQGEKVKGGRGQQLEITAATRRLQDMMAAGALPAQLCVQEAWVSHLQRNMSIVSRLCHGQMLSSLTCPCGHAAFSSDVFTCLPLPIPPEYMTLKLYVVSFNNGESAAPSADGTAVGSPGQDVSFQVMLRSVRLPKTASVGDVVDALAQLEPLPEGLQWNLFTCFTTGIPRPVMSGASIAYVGGVVWCYALEAAPTPRPTVTFIHRRWQPCTYQSQGLIECCVGAPLVLPASFIHSNAHLHQIGKGWARVCAAADQLVAPCPREPDMFYVGSSGIGCPFYLEAGHEAECAGCYCRPTTTPFKVIAPNGYPAMSMTVALDWGATADVVGFDEFDAPLQPAPSPAPDDPSQSAAHETQPESQPLPRPPRQPPVWTLLPACVQADRRQGGTSVIEQPVTLADCFNLFVKEEVLCKENQWKCPKCSENVQATKCIRLRRLPQVMICVLTRFFVDGARHLKVDTPVKFPVRGLDLQTWTDASSNDTPANVYDLFGVVNHFGTLSGGHYTAAVECPNTGQWYSYNDERVTPLVAPGASDAELEAALQSSCVYVLMYRQRQGAADMGVSEPDSEAFMEPDETAGDEEFKNDEPTAEFQFRQIQAEPTTTVHSRPTRRRPTTPPQPPPSQAGASAQW